jgi:hypothetical protein
MNHALTVHAPALHVPPAAPPMPLPPGAPAPSQRIFRQRTIEYWDHWHQQHGDHGVEAYDPDILSHDYDPLALGSFSIIRTRAGRFYALVRVHTVLGHLCLALHLERHAVERLAHMAHAAGEYATAGLFDDIGHAFKDIGHAVEHVTKDIGRGVEKAAKGVAQWTSHAVHDVAKTAQHIGAGVVHAAQGAINGAAHAIEQAAKTAGRAIDKSVKAAAHLVARAHLGDIDAGKMIQGIVNAAKSGVEWAKKAGNTLAKGAEFVAHAVDLPMIVASAIPIPAVQGFIKSISPLQKYADAVESLRVGDFDRLKKIATDTLASAQGVVSLIPGIGTAISSAVSAAEALLQGGSPIDIAIRAAYGAIPILPGVRQVTDTVLDAVLALVDGKNITDAGLAVVRDRIPAGVPRDVFDTLANIVVKHQPILKATEDLAAHYVKQYTSGIGDALEHGITSAVGPAVQQALHALPDASTVFAGFPKDLKEQASHLIGDASKSLGQEATRALQGAAHDVASAASAAATSAVHGIAQAAQSAIGAPAHFGYPSVQPKPPPPRRVAIRLGPYPAFAHA